MGERLRVPPVAVGGPDEAAAVLEAVSREALIVVSSDLSHCHDHATADAVLVLDHRAIGDRDACGADARQVGWTSTLLDLRTSADASGDLRQVVGYGAFALVTEEEVEARRRTSSSSG